MRMPHVMTSPRRLLAYFGVYLLARLQAHPATVALVATWNRAMNALQAALGASDAATRRQVLARAALDFADLTLDDAVRATAAAAKGDVGGRAEGPEWSRLFLVPWGEVVRLPILQEIEEAKRIEAEVASGATWRGARAHLPALTAARQGVERANAEYRAAVTASDTAGRQLGAAAEEWRMSYASIHGGLKERFPGKPTFVDSFFWTPTEPAEEEPSATPTPPTA